MATRAPTFGRSLTTWSVGALAVGLMLGILLHGSTHPAATVLPGVVSPLGRLWMAGLQMTIVPLVVTQLLAAIVGANGEGGGSLGALGGKALLLFLGLLVLGGLFAVTVAPPLVSLYQIDPETVERLRASASIPPSALQASAAGQVSFGDWLVALLPDNVFQAAVSGAILPLLLFTVIIALAITRLPAEPRDLMRRLSQAMAETMMVVVRWILVATPVGVFALSLELARGAGGQTAGFFLAFILVVSAALVIFTLLLYPMATLGGRVRLGVFARGVAPAQLVAVSTRSSMASLPALVEGGRTHLQLPGSATGFILPLSVATFKVNRTISSTTKLIFMAYVFGVPLGPGALATFVATVLLMSFGTAGVPQGAGFRTLPAYLAAGIPIEAVVVLEAVDWVPDIFKTVLNVTGDMTAATILSRGDRTKVAIPNLAGPPMGAPEGA